MISRCRFIRHNCSWQHRKSSGVGHGDLEVRYHALPDDDFTQRPSYEQLSHHSNIDTSVADEMELRPSYEIVVPVDRTGTVTPAKPDMYIQQPDSGRDHPVVVEQIDLMGHSSPIVQVAEERHRMVVSDEPKTERHPIVVSQEPKTLLDEEDVVSTSSRHSAVHSEFPLTWKAIEAMRGVKPRVTDGRRSRKRERRTSDSGSLMSGHVTPRSPAATSKSLMETRKTSMKSLPADGARKASSRASSSSAAVSSTWKRRKSRSERTRAREASLDRMAARKRDTKSAVTTPSSIDERGSQSTVKRSTSFQKVSSSRPAGKPPVNPTPGRAATVGDSRFVELIVPLSTPTSPRLSSPRRDLNDENVLREIRRGHRSSTASPAYRRNDVAIASASTSSWHSSPSPVLLATSQHLHSAPTPVRASHRGDGVFSSLIDKSTPRNASPVHLDHPSAAVGRSSMATRWPSPHRVVRGSPFPVSESLASRSVFVDSITGDRFAPPPPPGVPRHPSTTDVSRQNIGRRLPVAATLKDNSPKWSDSLDRTKSRLKFIVAVPKTTFLNPYKHQSTDNDHSPNVDNRSTIPHTSSADVDHGSLQKYVTCHKHTTQFFLTIAHIADFSHFTVLVLVFHV